MNVSTSHRKLIDYFYIGALVLYVLAGLRLVPFHGDESTIIYMSHDWFRSPLAIGYDGQRPGSGEAMDQDLRLLNGVISKDSFGLAYSVLGIGPDQLNTPWDWSSDWWVNNYYGHIPGVKVLWIARLMSTLMTALSVAVVFTIARWLADRPSAWLAAFVYTMMPLVLLNGRRAMFEGATLLTTTLIILLGLWVARQKPSLFRWGIFGLISGLGIASKHTSVLIVLPVWAVAASTQRRSFQRALLGSLCAGVIMASVFLILNPAWWSAPLRMPGIVLSLRQDLLSRQASVYQGQTVTDRVTALVRYPFGPPQYFEDPKYDWTQWIGSDIAAYEASWTGGLWGSIMLPLESLLVVVGMAFCVWRSWSCRDSRMILFLTLTMFITVSVFALTSVPWGRYYLPLAPPFAIASGLSVRWLAERPSKPGLLRSPTI